MTVQEARKLFDKRFKSLYPHKVAMIYEVNSGFIFVLDTTAASFDDNRMFLSKKDGKLSPFLPNMVPQREMVGLRPVYKSE